MKYINTTSLLREKGKKFFVYCRDREDSSEIFFIPFPYQKKLAQSHGLYSFSSFPNTLNHTMGYN